MKFPGPYNFFKILKPATAAIKKGAQPGRLTDRGRTGIVIFSTLSLGKSAMVGLKSG
jgi:hypothetical protein